MKKALNLLVKFICVGIAPLLVLSILPFIASFVLLDRYGADSTNGVLVLVSLFMIYSLCKQTVVHDRQTRTAYIEGENKGAVEAVKLVCGNGNFWAVYIATALLFFLAPVKAYLHIFANGKEDLASRIKVMAICLPVFLIIGVISTANASKVWDKHGDYPKKFTAAAFAEQIVMNLVIYMLGGGVLMFIAPYFSGIFTVITGLENAFSPNTVIGLCVLLGCVIIIPPCIRALRGLLKRKSFIKQLKSVCRQKGYVLSDIKVPYKSLFGMYAGESFTVKTDKATYSCKLLSSMKKGIPTVLKADGTVEFIHSFSIGKKGAKLELFRYVKKFNFAYEAQGTKVLIVIPVSKFMQTDLGGKTVDIDNGETVGEYKVFAGTGFVNALERECIEGARNKYQYKYI